jgi:Raf kinase inhibitor-like YbhB/YbcL family protein
MGAAAKIGLFISIKSITVLLKVDTCVNRTVGFNILSTLSRCCSIIRNEALFWYCYRKPRPMYFLIFISAAIFQPSPLTIICPDFINDGVIPSRLTCEGDKVNPTIIINGMPEGTKSLALVVEQTDASSKIKTQWIVWNIPPTETILENTVPGVQGKNSLGKTGYVPPCPEEADQRYVFKIYALDKMLTLSSKATRKQLDMAMDGHIRGTGQISAAFQRALASTSKSKK